MEYFPIYRLMTRNHVLLCGGGDAAEAKLRLLFKTTARISVFSDIPSAQINDWAAAKKITLHQRKVNASDCSDATLLYAANQDANADARDARLGRAAGAWINIVDNLDGSDFITPAIVDRDPVTIAIATEGAAPVLARSIKADLEASLPTSLGVLAKIGKAFRHVAARLPYGRIRRDFWSSYYFRDGPRALEAAGEIGAEAVLRDLARDIVKAGARSGHVSFVGAGPGDPELLTLKARRLLHEADMVIYDRMVPDAILELARREAHLLEMGKTAFGPATDQADINQKLVDAARQGHQVVRLKGGDPSIFGRLDEETAALDASGISYSVVPGITAASAASAAIGRSLTQRGRNRSVTFITAHDLSGFADHDWSRLAQNDQVTAIYMGKSAARFLQGRLLMHSASSNMPVTIVLNASRANQTILCSNVAHMSEALSAAALEGPALIFLGLSARKSEQPSTLQERVS